LVPVVDVLTGISLLLIRPEGPVGQSQTRPPRSSRGGVELGDLLAFLVREPMKFRFARQRALYARTLQQGIVLARL
jgi:hypothetical protein